LELLGTHRLLGISKGGEFVVFFSVTNTSAASEKPLPLLAFALALILALTRLSPTEEDP
jgi:ABC-type Fe3+-siderophore transport system permease subunit